MFNKQISSTSTLLATLPLSVRIQDLFVCFWYLHFDIYIYEKVGRPQNQRYFSFCRKKKEYIPPFENSELVNKQHLSLNYNSSCLREPKIWSQFGSNLISKVGQIIFSTNSYIIVLCVLFRKVMMIQIFMMMILRISRLIFGPPKNITQCIEVVTF